MRDMGRLKKMGGWLLVAWGTIRVLPDTLESVQATAKYARWMYVHAGLLEVSGGRTTLLILLVGMALLLSERLAKAFRGFKQRPPTITITGLTVTLNGTSTTIVMSWTN